MTTTAPKPTPIKENASMKAARLKKEPVTAHLMQKPFQNRGLADLKIRLTNR